MAKVRGEFAASLLLALLPVLPSCRPFYIHDIAPRDFHKVEDEVEGRYGLFVTTVRMLWLSCSVPPMWCPCAIPAIKRYTEPPILELAFQYSIVVLKQNLFEDQQQQLQSNAEKLSMFLVNDFQTFLMEVIEMMRYIINLSNVVYKLCKQMLCLGPCECRWAVYGFKGVDDFQDL